MIKDNMQRVRLVILALLGIVALLSMMFFFETEPQMLFNDAGKENPKKFLEKVSDSVK